MITIFKCKQNKFEASHDIYGQGLSFQASFKLRKGESNKKDVGLQTGSNKRSAATKVGTMFGFFALIR